ncbi:MAG: hypothetical protein OXI39_03055 [Gemmatimonadota bacterium]|uniref:hypothetical protein n=1 Tax=Candidatus Palauibacter scopulicola TaxID=3056741 RepID=UPI0023A762CC|nr:hypothetical protein [Candidatus Palauibacter scopulicola]MDE2661972.1 hypothetical protein [Candidatus Palauibacter scopulicola]
MSRTGLVLVSALLPVLVGSCGGAAPDGAERLPGSAGSLEELATTVLVGLAAADTVSLETVRLTEDEHNDLVWPELPASAPEVNYPVDLAWKNIRTRNRAALSDLFAVYENRELQFVHAECRGFTEAFDSFVVHTDCWVTLERDGERLPPQQLFKDVLDREGGLKIFRYYEP